MSITKQFLLVFIIFQINASQNYTEKQQKNFLVFTQRLSQQTNADDMNLARWINETYVTNDNLAGEFINIVNTSTSFDNAKESIKNLKNTTEQTETDKTASYFSNISTFTKAAAAFIITASIASYFYFMRPWTSSNQ
jgi:hypothetical protein